MLKRDVIFLVWTFLDLIHGQKCTIKYFGTDKPRDKDNKNQRLTDAGYLLGVDQQSDCCGLVTSWVASFDDTGASHSVHFGVWRENGTANTFELIGENQLTVTNNGEKTLTVTGSDRILIKPNDRFGWWVSGTEILAYKDDGDFANVLQILPMLDKNVGDTQDFSTATSISANTYAIRINVGPDNNPQFDNLPGSITIPSDAADGTSLFVVSASDQDQDTVVEPLVITMDTHAEFEFDDSAPNTIEITSLTTLSGDITLTFSVTDVCGNVVTSTYTVTIVNPAPIIHDTPTSMDLSEDTTAFTSLYTVNVTDGDPVTCTKATSVPAGWPFIVQLIPSTSNYGIYSEANPGFDYDTQRAYNIKVTCTDTVSTVTSDDYWVYLLKNQAPIFHNIQNKTTAQTTMGAATSIFDVLVTDPEGDTLSFTMTSDPTPAPFQILASGAIVTTQDLSDQVIVGYDLFITVTDSKNTVGPSTLTVIFSDLNNPVNITNLPLPSPLAIAESSPLGVTLYTVAFKDVDVGQAHTFTITSSPTDGLNYFDITTSGEIVTAGSIIDYETLASKTFTLSVTVADPLVSDTKTLMVDIFNVNEPPSFGLASYGISSLEGPADKVIGTPTFGVTDPDVGDTHALSMDCGIHTSYFYIDANTGTVTFQMDYDLDTGSYPTSVPCTVFVTDSGGLKANATLTILISDDNDNTPIFNPKWYNFFISYFAGPGTTIGQVTATDKDAGAFGTITYSLDQSSLATPHFTIAADGTIAMLLEPQASSSALNYSSQYILKAVATDSGLLSATATIEIIISDTTTTTTTTVAPDAKATGDDYKTFFEDVKNLAWFIPCAVLVFCAIVATCWVIFTCRGAHGCKSCMNAFMNRNKVKLILRDKERPPYREYKQPRAPMNLSDTAKTFSHKDSVWRTSQRF